MPADTTTVAKDAQAPPAALETTPEPGLASKIKVGKTVVELKAPTSPSRCFAVAALLATDDMACRGAALGLCWDNRKLGVRLASFNFNLRDYGHAVNDAVAKLYGWSMPRVRAVGTLAVAHILEQVPTQDDVDEAEAFFEVLEERSPG